LPPARAAQAQQSLAPFIIAAGVLLGVAATVFGFPGVAVGWAGLLVAAIMEPQPMLTGKRPGGGVQAEGPAEEAAQKRYTTMRELKWRLIAPNGDWLPGWKPQASWVLGVVLGVIALALPVAEPSWAWGNAAAAALLTWNLAACRRRSAAPQDPCPGVRLDKSLTANPTTLIVGGITGLAVAVLSYLLAWRAIPMFFMSPAVGDFAPRPVLIAAGTDTLTQSAIQALVSLALGALVAGVVAWSGWSQVALYEWRSLVESRARWDTVWPSVGAVTKKAGGPRQVAHEEVGHLIVDTFESPPDVGAEAAVRAAGAIATAYGAGTDLVALRAPNVDPQGQPVFGSMHPTRFVVVTTGLGEKVDVADANIDPKVLNWVLSFAVNSIFREYGLQPTLVSSVEPLHTPPTPDEQPKRKKLDKEAWAKKVTAAKAHGGGFWASLKSGDALTKPETDTPTEQRIAPPQEGAQRALWKVTLAPSGNTKDQMHTAGSMVAGILETGVIIDASDPRPGENSPRAPFRGAQAFIIGDTSVAPKEMESVLAAIGQENEWRPRWSGALKMGAAQPTPQYVVTVRAQYNGAEVIYTPHLMPQGRSLDDYRGYDKQLATTIGPPPPDFITVTGYPGMSGRPGDRHPQAFAVVYSLAPMPTTPQQLAPGAGSVVNRVPSTVSQCPEHWIIAWMVNRAFASARLAYPEVAVVRHLSQSRSGTHLWKVTVRLYDGVTLSHVRAAIGKIQSVLGAPWVKVAPDESDPQCITLVIGDDYRKVRLDRPQRDLLFLTDLEWQSAFESAKIRTASGLIPSITAISHLPANEKVSVLDVALPAGVDKEMMVAGIAKLKAATGNDFIEVRPGAGGASTVQMYVCETDPMPMPAPFDFDAVDASGSTEAPFATGVEGSYISYNWMESSAGLVSGGAGSGKSVTLEGILYGAISKGCDVYVGDAQKQAADFAFARPYVKGFATTVEEVAAMLRACVAEYERRQSLMGRYGVSKYIELPDDLRPPHAIVFLDEFNGLIGADKPRKPQVETPESMQVFAEAMADFVARQDILSAVTQIVTKARAAGFSVLLGAQRLTADMMKALPNATAMKASLSTRLLVGKATFGDKQVALKDAVNSPELGDSVPKGRAVFEPAEAASIAVQSWFVHPMQDTLGAELAKRISPRTDVLDLATLVETAKAKAAEQEVAIEGAVIEESGAEGTVVPEAGVVDLGEMHLDDLGLDLGEITFDDLALDDEPSTDTSVDDFVAAMSSTQEPVRPEQDVADDEVEQFTADLFDDEDDPVVETRFDDGDYGAPDWDEPEPETSPVTSADPASDPAADFWGAPPVQATVPASADLVPARLAAPKPVVDDNYEDFEF